MKKSRFTEEQIIGVLREADGKSPVKAVCAEHNVSEATFYAWKKYGGMDMAEARRLKALEEENRRLKNLVADQAVQREIAEPDSSQAHRQPRKTKDSTVVFRLSLPFLLYTAFQDRWGLESPLVGRPSRLPFACPGKERRWQPGRPPYRQEATRPLNRLAKRYRASVPVALPPAAATRRGWQPGRSPYRRKSRPATLT